MFFGIIVFAVAGVNIYPVRASLFDLGNVSSGAISGSISETEKDMGVNPNTINDYASTFN